MRIGAWLFADLLVRCLFLQPGVRAAALGLRAGRGELADSRILQREPDAFRFHRLFDRLADTRLLRTTTGSRFQARRASPAKIRAVDDRYRPLQGAQRFLPPSPGRPGSS